MPRRKHIWVALIVLVCGIIIFIIWSQPPASSVTVNLPDGKSVKVRASNDGKFYQGVTWQKALFTLCGTNISPRLRGAEITIPMMNANGSIFLELENEKTGDQEVAYFKKFGGSSKSINGNSQLSQLNAPGNEVKGRIRMVNFTVPDSLIARYAKNWNTETIYWEFPETKERELRFRFYYTNALNGDVSTNEFAIANPIYK